MCDIQGQLSTGSVSQSRFVSDAEADSYEKLLPVPTAAG